MDTSPEQSKPRPSRLKRFLRIALFIFVCLATLIALAITEENWRGRRDWEKFKREWEAKGEQFDLASVVPPAVPDDQNFSTASIFAGAFNMKANPKSGELEPIDPSIPDRLHLRTSSSLHPPGQSKPIETPSMGSWQNATRTDLQGWQQYYRAVAAISNEFPVPAQPQTPAADILVALSKYDSIVDELRQAARRPASRFPIRYEDGFGAATSAMGAYGKFKGCSQLLVLRSEAELANNETDKALADIELSLRFVQALRSEPFLINHMVSVAIFHITLNPIWQGLADHKWSNEQLVALERALQGFDFLDDYSRAMHGERAFAVWSIDAGFDGYSSMPRGWRYQNQIAICRMSENYVLPMVDFERRVVSPEHVRKLSADFKATHHFSFYDAFTPNLFPAVAKANQQFAGGQCSLDLARVALALERFRIAHGQYPDTLDALSPAFVEKLPHDVINGQPLKYRKANGSGFVLYSVGWNEKDDGGTVALKKEGGVDREKGDWVWRYE
jgi:hypothetical protein